MTPEQLKAAEQLWRASNAFTKSLERWIAVMNKKQAKPILTAEK